MKKASLFVVFLALAGALAPAARAGEITVAWDATPGATAYRVYYGTAPGNYGGSITTSGLNTTLTGLQDCTSHFIAVKAVNGAGESAQFSNEVSGWPRPTISSATPATAMQGTQAVLELVGTNFQSGATVDLGDAQIVLSAATVLSCNRLQVLATVEPMAANVAPAEVGRKDITVANSDEVFGYRSQGFEVLINPARFDINKSDSATTNRIDGKDTIYLSRQFGLNESNAAFDPDDDFDGDGWIDGSDLAYIASNLGRCWSASTQSWSASACPTALR